MNKWIGTGRLTRDQDVRHSFEGDKEITIARFSLAVDRPGKKAEKNNADFFNCTAFGKQAEFVEKYVKQGTRLLVTARVQNDVYTNREGQKVYAVQMLVDSLEFCESKASAAKNNKEQSEAPSAGGFMNIPDGMDDEELPFN